jgi:hypothetical protein
MHTLRLSRLRKLNEQGFDHAIVAVFCVVVVGVIGTAMIVASHALPSGKASLKSRSSARLVPATV